MSHDNDIRSLKSMLYSQNVKIECLEVLNKELRESILHHEVNLNLNKEMLGNILKRLDPGLFEEESEKKPKKAWSWWNSRKNSNPQSNEQHKDTFLMTVKTLSTENSNLTRQVFEMQHILKEKMNIIEILKSKAMINERKFVPKTKFSVEVQTDSNLVYDLENTVKKLESKVEVYTDKIDTYEHFLKNMCDDYDSITDLERAVHKFLKKNQAHGFDKASDKQDNQDHPFEVDRSIEFDNVEDIHIGVLGRESIIPHT